MLANGFWSTEAKVEGIMPKVAWHWVRDNSIVNDPLEEPGPTHLYEKLPSAWSTMDGDLMFFPLFRRATLWGLLQTYRNE